MKPAPAEAVAAAVAGSALNAEYGKPLDRDSAYERLAAKLAPPPAPTAPAPGPAAPAPAPSAPARGRAPKPEESMVQQVVKSSAFKSFLRSAGTVLGREITRSVLGTARKTTRRR